MTNIRVPRHHRTRWHSGFTLMASLLAVSLLAACSEDTPLGPDEVTTETSEAPWGYPTPITSFSVASTTTSSVTLRFTEAHNGLGGAADYEIRYMATPIGSRWNSATRVTSGTCRSPISGSGWGTTRTCTVTGLSANTSYDFQIVGMRDGWFSTLYGDVSSPVTARTGGATTNPTTPTVPGVVGTISDLSVISTTSTTATLRFTSVDDGRGSPANNQVGFAFSPISLNMSSAALASQGSCSGRVQGSSVGATVTCTVEGLRSGRTYDFQVRPYRGTGSSTVYGELSNTITASLGSTSPPPPASQTIASVSVSPGTLSLILGGTSQLTAVARDSNGNVISGVDFSWSSSNSLVASVTSTGFVRGLLAGLANITVSAGGRSASTGVSILGLDPGSGGTTGGGGGAIGTSFTREPAGLTRRTHAQWRQGSMPSGWGMRTSYPGSAVRLVSDASSPTGGALEMFYPAGLQDGLQPGVTWFSGSSIRNAQEVFLGVVMKYSNNWITHSNEVKLHLFATGGSWLGIFDGCWNNRQTQWSVGSRVISGYPVGNGDCWANNVAASPRYTNGQWVRQEMYIRRNTPGQRNGIVRLWINGQLISETTTMQFPSNFEFQEFQHAGTWGGGGPNVPQDQSVFIAETYLSSR